MSSLFIINKAIDRASGTGLPFYNNPDYIFSVSNNQFNDTNGLWRVPNDRIPTFQIHVENNVPADFATILVRCIETKGGNNFTGYFVDLPLASVIMVKRASKDGTTINIFQSDDNYKLAEPLRCGRWILQISVDNGALINIFYSEEFVTYK